MSVRDVGRLIDSPIHWGHVSRLAPEEDVATAELTVVTQGALDELPFIGIGVLTLVDMKGVSSGMP